MKIKCSSLFLLVIVFFFAVGAVNCKSCNVFYWTYEMGAANEATDEMKLQNAQEYINNGDYDKAKEMYDEILKEDPDNSQALYGRAQTNMAKADIDYITVMTVMSDTNAANDPATRQKLAQMANSLANVSPDVIADLEKIKNGQGDGSVSPNDPKLNMNLGMAYSGQLLTSAKDSNGNITEDSIKAKLQSGEQPSAQDKETAQKALDSFQTAVDNGLAQQDPALAQALGSKDQQGSILNLLANATK